MLKILVIILVHAHIFTYIFPGELIHKKLYGFGLQSFYCEVL